MRCDLACYVVTYPHLETYRRTNHWHEFNLSTQATLLTQMFTMYAPIVGRVSKSPRRTTGTGLTVMESAKFVKTSSTPDAVKFKVTARRTPPDSAGFCLCQWRTVLKEKMMPENRTVYAMDDFSTVIIVCKRDFNGAQCGYESRFDRTEVAQVMERDCPRCRRTLVDSNSPNVTVQQARIFLLGLDDLISGKLSLGIKLEVAVTE